MTGDISGNVSDLDCKKECEKMEYKFETSLSVANMKPFEVFTKANNQTYDG